VSREWRRTSRRVQLYFADPFQVIQHVRESENLRQLPIFGMTAKSWTSEEMTVLSRATQALFQKKWFVAATAHPGSAPGNQSM
jgi:hypothetical protein